ncbi:MAG: glycosyltransferase [Verrucomicrobia bacterium]|nr:glycosyltransferase [Verrucomicrobiota bacterium]
MIFLDVTKTGKSAHRSGLMRVTGRLMTELGAAATPVRWPEWDRRMGAGDWFLTAELFSEAERPGLGEFLRAAAGRKSAIFPDAIPLKHPHITWPHSVARHPGYMKLLASFDHVWGISATVRDDLVGFWRWQGLDRVPPVDVLMLGSDFDGSPRVTAERVPRRPGGRPSLLCVGILEPRKNQALLLDACEDLWGEGLDFELHVVGRVNPHFGAPMVARIRALRRRFKGISHHEGVGDAELARLYAEARATVFPTIAEGCGLPLLESLWRGVPCVCSDLPVLRENAGGGGCLPVAVNDRAAWRTALRQMLTDDALWTGLATEARLRALPTWAETAATLRARLR